MKKLIIVGILIYSFSICYSQTGEMMPLYIEVSAQDIPSHTCSQRLENKLRVICSNYGLSASSELMTDYSLIAEYNNYNIDKYTGFKPSFLITGEILLYFQNNKHDIESSSLILNFNGNGSSIEQAFNSGLNNLRIETKNLETFFKEGKNKMLSFGASQCKAIISKAKRHIQTSSYLKAIETLNMVSIESQVCETELLKLLEGSYLKLIDKKCNELLLKGQSKLAIGHYEEALEYFNMIDPESACYQELIYFIDEIKYEVESKEFQRNLIELMRKKDQIELEKYRLSTMVEIAKAINKPNYTNIYSFIIR